MRYYDLFIPVGSFCAASYHLRRSNLQIEALPFDWIADLTFSKSIDFIASQFEDFFKKENLKFLKIEGPNICCLDTKYDLGFLHHMDCSLPFDDAYKKAKNTLNRRCARLLEKIQKAQSILLVYTENKELNLEIIQSSLSKLQRIYPEKNIDLLIFDLSPEHKYSETYSIGKNITVAKINFELQKDTFSGKAKEFKNVLKNYHQTFNKGIIASTMNIYWNNFRRYFVKIICMFIFNKEKRKVLRKKFHGNNSIFDK